MLRETIPMKRTYTDESKKQVSCTLSSLPLLTPDQLLTLTTCILKLQWLKDSRLVCHGYFELVFIPYEKNPIAADSIVFWDNFGRFSFLY